MPLPPIDSETAYLPPGEHRATWSEIVERFGWNPTRRALLDGLHDALTLLAEADCSTVWLNGSFVTAKDEPGDFAATWDDVGSGSRFAQFFQLDRRWTVEGQHRHHRPQRGPPVITNDVRYRNTKAWAERFEADAADMEASTPPPRSRLQQAKIDAARSQADDLRRELAAYEALRSGAVRSFEASSLLGLADALVKARVARGWTQRRLAEELGVAEQQVQRYESTGYSSASLARLADIAAALGVTVTETVTINENSAA